MVAPDDEVPEQDPPIGGPTAEHASRVAGATDELGSTVRASLAAPAAAAAGFDRARLGRALTLGGGGLLPVGVGVVFGFFAADRGVRWLPSMLGILLVLAAVSLAAVLVGGVLSGGVHRMTPEGRRVRRRVLVVLGLLSLALTVRLVLFWVTQPTPLTAMSPAEFNRAFAADATQYREYDENLRSIIDALARRESAFAADAVLGPEDETALRQSWAALHDAAFALDQIREFYEDWYRFDPSRAERDRHLRSFLLTFAAELALYEKAARFVALVERNPNAVKFLDAPHDALALPAGSLSRFKQELLGARDQARVIAGQQYLRWLASAFEGEAEADGLGVSWLWRDVEAHIASVTALGMLARTDLQLGADVQVLRRAVRRAWYPAQSKVAEWMGDTRVRRPGWYLIDEAQQERMDAAAEPGDVMLSRKNWYVSNVGLPGFWPHAILYLGAPDKLAAYFDDDPEVRAWLRGRSGRDEGLTDHLAREHPSAWLRYQAGTAEGPYRVIEAISEGVSLNTLAHASGDYLAVLRPRLDRRAKAQAVVEAFAHEGKPYDYDFDFATDHALVCTELVWRSYRPGPDKPGLRIPLVDMAGRKTLPANAIAGLFAAERGRAEAQLDFVWFYDAHEHERRAFEADEDAFARSFERVKWDIALR